jgi:hypothetical protein
MIRRVRPEVKKEEKTYPVLLRVRTSAINGAGTSAAVFVSLYGTTGEALKQVNDTKEQESPSNRTATILKP